ncbi:hypothetical protein BH23BAC2_BH23BAC2_10790 [soil metagenome]
MFSILVIGCKNKAESGGQDFSSEETVDSTNIDKNILEDEQPRTPAFIALTANALQIVDASTGSTQELPVGAEMSRVVEIMERILNTKLPDPQVNSECGAGPMTILSLKNGLILMFQNSARNDSGRLEFVGWSLTEGILQDRKITTMAGIGIGSTRRELKDVYTIELKNTSLGTEFSIGSEIFGILNSSDEIEFMWSGTACNFT